MPAYQNLKKMEMWKFKRTLAKVFRYEYWPFMVFFLPLLPVWLYYAWRNKSWVYFTAVNPGIYLSGLFGESKKDILQNIDAKYLPTTLYLEPNTDIERVSLLLMQHAIEYPFILKPDVGERGNDVAKITTAVQLEQYLQSHGEKQLIIQEFVAYELEFGVFYYKYPNGSGSGISSITGKKFLAVIGDGYSTLAQLIQSDVRASMQYERLSKVLHDQMTNVLAKGEELLLEPVGNHCRGTMFLNRTALVNEKLVKVFDEIAKGYEGFYFGRFDLKVRSIADFYEGRHIKVMELNGVTSEPAHVYDPQYSLWKAYRDIARNMKICADIARQNHENGVPYLNAKDIFIYLKDYFKTHGKHTQQSPEPIFDYAHH